MQSVANKMLTARHETFCSLLLTRQLLYTFIDIAISNETLGITDLAHAKCVCTHAVSCLGIFISIAYVPSWYHHCRGCAAPCIATAILCSKRGSATKSL